jgi:hypothetical protein
MAKGLVSRTRCSAHFAVLRTAGTYAFASQHACHAQIARRANLSQPVGIAVTPKSATDFAPSRLDKRGVRVVTNVERDAVDAKVLSTNGINADGEVVWSWRPDAGVKLRGKCPRDDGGKRARSPGRARNKPLKPLRRECRLAAYL